MTDTLIAVCTHHYVAVAVLAEHGEPIGCPWPGCRELPQIYVHGDSVRERVDAAYEAGVQAGIGTAIVVDAPPRATTGTVST